MFLIPSYDLSVYLEEVEGRRSKLKLHAWLSRSVFDELNSMFLALRNILPANDNICIGDEITDLMVFQINDNNAIQNLKIQDMIERTRIDSRPRVNMIGRPMEEMGIESKTDPLATLIYHRATKRYRNLIEEFS